jgi:DME family drug/metabolite transporter
MKGIILVLLATFLWGTTGTTQAFSPAEATPLVIGTMRMIIGGLFLTIIAIINKSFTKESKWPFIPTILGILGVALYQVCFFYAVKLTGVAVGTIIAIGCSPIIMGILSRIVFNERITKIWILSTFLAILGGVLLILSENSGEINLNIIGIILALGAGTSYSVYAVACKKLLKYNQVDAIMTVFFAGAGLLMLPTLFFADISWIATTNGFLLMLYLGIFATAFSYMLFSRGLKLISVSTAGTLSLGEPLTAALLGIFLLDETIKFQGILGIFLLFLGLLLLSVKRQ